MRLWPNSGQIIPVQRALIICRNPRAGTHSVAQVEVAGALYQPSREFAAAAWRVDRDHVRERAAIRELRGSSELRLSPNGRSFATIQRTRDL